MRAFAQPARDRLRRRQEDVVAEQVRALTDILNRGDVLYLAPEGLISPDGWLQAFRSGLRQILACAEAPVRLLPACIVDDFMRPGRLKVHLTMGEEMEASAGPPAAVGAAVRRSIAALHAMTTSQVISQTVWTAVGGGREALATGGLIAATRERVAALRSAGLRVDDDLVGAGVSGLLTNWTRYVARKGYATPGAGEVRFDVARIVATPVTHWENPIRYCVNEVQSVLAALASSPVAVETVSP